jgi:YggT family protein
MSPAIYFIFKTLGELALFVFILRFWLPLFRADFRNPISQNIMKFTSPLINPLRKYLPSFKQIDSASILVPFILQYILISILLIIADQKIDNTTILLGAFFELCLASADLFFFAIIIHIFFSWTSPASYTPLKSLVENIAEPLLRPYRNFFRPIGGMDLSPIFAIIAIQAVIIFLRNITPLQL